MSEGLDLAHFQKYLDLEQSVPEYLFQGFGITGPQRGVYMPFSCKQPLVAASNSGKAIV
jgi:hypothetical protein